jgi:hypothetical protein
MHVEVGKLAVVSTSSWRASAGVGDDDVYGMSWSKQERGKIYASMGSLQAKEREQGNGQIDCNLHLGRRRSTR